MPFGDEILSIDNASVDSRFQFLFFQPMIVHDPHVLKVGMASFFLQM